MEGFEERQLEPTSSHHTAYNSSTSSDYHLGQHQFSLSAYGQQHHQHSVPMPPHIIIPPQPHQQEPHSAGPYYSPADTSHDIVAYVGSHAVVENSKCTNALVGQTFVQPANVDYKGEKALMFVFAVGALLSLWSGIRKSDFLYHSFPWSVFPFSGCLHSLGSGGEDRGLVHPTLPRV